MFKINILTVEKIYSAEAISSVPLELPINKKPCKIQVIQKHEFIEYTKMLENTKTHIEFFYKKYKSREKYIKIVDKLWKIFHEKLVSPFAEIKLGYAITTHKAQGSTFGSVFVDAQDIGENPDKDEMQRALYTAASRASMFLGFLAE